MAWISDLPELKGQEFATSKEAHEAEAAIQGGMMKKQALDELGELLGRNSAVQAGQGAEDRTSAALSAMPRPEPTEGRTMSRGFAIPEDEEAKIFAGMAAQKQSEFAPEEEIGMFRAKYPTEGESFQAGLKDDTYVRRGEADIAKKGAETEKKQQELDRPPVDEVEKAAIAKWAEDYGKNYPAAAEMVKSAINANDIETAKDMQKKIVAWMQRVDILNREEENRKRASERRSELKDKDREKTEYEWQQRENIKSWIRLLLLMVE